MTDPISIEPFTGEQAVADMVAAMHLRIRLEQRQEGTNRFEPGVTDIYDSQEDLKHMRKYYVEPGGNFWIARDTACGSIVGFVGFKRTSASSGALKRMAVLKEYRRQHIGQQLGSTLIDWARGQGLSSVTLGTGVDEEAHDLYVKLGFVDTGFGKDGADYQMRLDLTK